MEMVITSAVLDELAMPASLLDKCEQSIHDGASGGMASLTESFVDNPIRSLF